MFPASDVTALPGRDFWKDIYHAHPRIAGPMRCCGKIAELSPSKKLNAKNNISIENTDHYHHLKHNILTHKRCPFADKKCCLKIH
jgi:hypothetical protein